MVHRAWQFGRLTSGGGRCVLLCHSRRIEAEAPTENGEFASYVIFMTAGEGIAENIDPGASLGNPPLAITNAIRIPMLD
jgi:hypothetical protein